MTIISKPVNLNVNVINILNSALTSAKSQLQSLAQNPQFQEKMAPAFEGYPNSFNTSIMTEYSFSDLNIELRSQSELNGANSSYSSDTGTIHLAYEYLQQTNHYSLTTVFLEEYKRHLDFLINSEQNAAGNGNDSISAEEMEARLSAVAMLTM